MSNSLYPTIPSAPENEIKSEAFTDHNFRLKHIEQLRDKLELDRDARKTLYKKYKRGINVLDNLSNVFIFMSVSSGATGLGLLVSVVGSPATLPLEIVAIVGGVLSGFCKFFSKRLEIKSKKHDNIRILAEAKLNTISNHINDAINDNNISASEFKLITDEIEKYKQMKDEIRRKVVKDNNKDEKKEIEAFLKKGQELMAGKSL